MYDASVTAIECLESPNIDVCITVSVACAYTSASI